MEAHRPIHLNIRIRRTKHRSFRQMSKWEMMDFAIEEGMVCNKCNTRLINQFLSPYCVRKNDTAHSLLLDDRYCPIDKHLVRKLRRLLKKAKEEALKESTDYA